jgi:N-acetylmuramoyl-L-alanine amidase
MSGVPRGSRALALRSRLLSPTAAALALGLMAAGCATAPSRRDAPPPVPPGVTVEPTPELPPVPSVDGALAIDVVYPDSGQTVATDSTFVFGSVGSGRAQLTINGMAVAVAPNGAFLAFLPTPADGVYRVQATKDGARATAERTIARPTSVAAAPGATIQPGSAYPSGALAVPADLAVEVGFRGTPGGLAYLVLPGGQRIPLFENMAVLDAQPARDFQTQPGAAIQRPQWARYEGMMPPQPLLAGDTAVARPRIGRGLPGETAEASVELVVAGDTARMALPLSLALLDPSLPRVAIVTPPPDALHDWEVRGRAHTNGPFHWFWPPGTQLRIIEQRGGMLRAQLTETLSAWVPAGDVRLLPPGSPLPFSTIGGVRFVHQPEAIDVHLPMSDALPFRVDENDDVLTIDVYGAKSTTNFFQYGRLDPLIERAEWSQPDDDIYRVMLDLRQPIWGYTTFRAPNGDLVVRVRRPPVIDTDAPLRGLRIALDAGHPPGGAIGPTRLMEAEANLAIARALRPLLERAGAHVIMIRDDPDAVGLGDRPRMATDSNAHLLVSVHNNAFPDGVNPFANNGTSTYYYQPHAAQLARHMQRELLAELQLRDIGIGRADLALARPTWMPAVLTETMFLMLPRQEAALRDPDVHERIAHAHLRALEAFLRERAQTQMR